jgi:hypothetical protein
LVNYLVLVDDYSAEKNELGEIPVEGNNFKT